MAAKIFINYRRDDSAGHAGRIHDRLEHEFGRDLLFMDVDGIPLGTNFVTILQDAVAKCDVLLAIIGPDWLDAKGVDGDRRLDHPDDFVRLEIVAALSRGIRVVPVLLEDTRMPQAQELPQEMKGLSLRNALSVRHASFHRDIAKLIGELKAGDIGAQGTSPKRSRSEERLAKVDQLITEFFQPIKSRLEKDNAIWRRIIRDKSNADSIEYRMAAVVEREHVLPNHAEIISIIEKWRHLIDDDKELCSVLNAYVDHVVVFTSIRSAGDDWTYPELMGSPWPTELYPLIDARLAALIAERAALMGNT
jgi:TIR domain